MRFNTHSELEGRHSFLSPSKYHWIRYDDEKVMSTFRTAMAAMRGTELHELAFNAIRLGVKLQASKKTLNQYVNDAIGFKMKPEVMLCYSINAFGTVDCISFRNNVLRIHDLKTGVSKTSFDQLCIYVAYFCLEYDIRPGDIDIQLRIYQNDTFVEFTPEVHDIVQIMSRTVSADKLINKLRAEEAA